MKKLLLITTIMMICTVLSAQVIHVPGDYGTIQEGINAASNGDMVLVDTGTYFENINFRGKAITVASHYIDNGDTNYINNTIIDGSQPMYTDSAAVVTFCNFEDTTSILVGFTITGGAGLFYPNFFGIRAGGGIACWNAGAKILNNKIIDNNANASVYAGGGGIACITDSYSPWMVIKNNTVSFDTSTSISNESFGAGIYVLSFAIIENNIIEHNYSYCQNGLADGGGIGSESLGTLFDKKIFLSDNTIQNNTVEGYNAKGGGIYCNNSSADIYNCIIRNNVVLAQNNGSGGGIKLRAGTEKVNIVGNEISDNTLYSDNNSFGGAMMLTPRTGSAFVMNNTVIGNTSNAAEDAYCGGIYVFWNESETSVQNNIIHNNSTSGGIQSMAGGLIVDKPHSKTRITGNSFVNNEASGGYEYGGAIALYEALDVEVLLDQNLIAYNFSGYTGGGFYAHSSYNVKLYNNVIVNNEAANRGGALSFYQSTDSKDQEMGMSVLVRSQNIETLNKSTYRPIIFNNTMAGNTASLGGAISTNANANSPVLINSIFWNNEASTLGNEIDNLGAQAIHVSYCNIDTAEIIGLWEGEENINEDPQFEPGDTICHINGVPCHNAGINELEVGGITYYAPEMDYDGDPRPQGDYWDIGSDECLMPGIGNNFAESSLFDLKTDPNPTSGIVKIRYKIEENSSVYLSIMNMQGEVVDVFVPLQQTPGKHAQRLNIAHLPDGLYLVRLQVGKHVETAKIIIMK